MHQVGHIDKCGLKPNSQTLYQSLQQQYYAHIPFNLEPESITKAIQAFFKFLELPEDIKSHINFFCQSNNVWLLKLLLMCLSTYPVLI